MDDARTSMDTHAIDLCPACGARRVSGASACWQCGGAFTAAPKAPVSSFQWVRLPWAGVIPLGLFFLPWVVVGRYGVHRVISIAGLELALGRTLRGRSVLHEPLLWLIPIISLLLVILLVRVYRRTSEPRRWLLVAITAWAGFALLLFKAVQWLWASPSPETVWVVHWLTTEYLVSGSAFLLSALAATRAWTESKNSRSQLSSSPFASGS